MESPNQTPRSESPRFPTPRNLKLDFFRGWALLVIFINHTPANEASLYTPSRYGLSDAAEIFVFLSGYAAALAYGKSFQRSGLWLGSLRVFYRCAQIYAAHLGLFFLMAIICVLGNTVFGKPDYVGNLNLQHFFDHTQEALLELASLRYVPNYFDILPLYLVVMSWIPVIVMLSWVHRGLALALPVLMYLAMWEYGMELPADLHSPRPWFFNPFGWQLLFFTGFALGQGWIKPLPQNSCLTVACVLALLLCLPLSPEPAFRPTADLQRWYADLQPWLDKTRLGPLRWLHFLILAHLAATFLSRREHWLDTPIARPLIRVGQQSLPIFILTMVFSHVGGMVLDQWNHGIAGILLVNVGGCVLLIISAQGLAWLKSSPWKIQGQKPEAESGLRTLSAMNGAAVLLAGLLVLVPLAGSQRPGAPTTVPAPAEMLVATEPSLPKEPSPLMPEMPEAESRPWP